MRAQRHIKRRITLLALLAAVVTLLAPTTALAHAALDRATPGPNAVLEQSPDRVTLGFSEPLEREFSSVRVLNSAGRQVDVGQVAFDPSDAKIMSVALPPGLPRDTYTVSWRSLSTVDGHTVRDSYFFSVGEPITGAQPAEQQPVVQSPLDPVVRWLVLLSAMVLVGGLAVDTLVLRPVLTGNDAPAWQSLLRTRLVARVRRLWWVAAGIFTLASFGWLLVQASVVGASPTALLGSTDWGHLWLWRAGLFAGLCAVFSLEYGERSSRRARDEVPYLSLAIGLGLLLTFSLTSHAGTVPGLEIPGVITDYVHLLAAALWVGGLVVLAASLPLVLRTLDGAERRDVLARMLPRFSFLAGLGVAILTVTGLYSAWLQVTVLPALLTPYGLVLLAKAAVIAVLLGVAAFNLFWVSPRLRHADHAGRLLRRTAAAEAALAVVVILLVGAMTSMAPARQAALGLGVVSAAPRFQERAGGLNIAAVVEPGRVGPNTFRVTLTDRQGKPADVTDVTLILRHLGADLGDQTVVAQRQGQGVFAVQGHTLSIAGPWQAELVVRRPDAFDARTAFRFEVQDPSRAGTAIVPEPSTGNLLWGIEIAALGSLLITFGILLGGWWRRRGQALVLPGITMLLIGLAIAVSAQFGSGQGVTVNPILPSAQSLEAGARLYARDCTVCHGPAGQGDGPQAASLNPPPLDLTVHVPMHDDRTVFTFIERGVAGTAMAAYGDTYTDEEIWHTVHYLRSLAEASLPPTATVTPRS